MIVSDQRTGSCIHSGPHWGLGQRNAKRHLAGLANKRYQTAHRHEYDVAGFVIAIRSCLAKRSYGNNHEPRIELRTVQRSGRKCFNEKVGPRCKPQEESATAGLSNVERDPPLARVVADEVQAFFRIRNVVGKRSEPPRGIALRRFNLDHIGAEVRKDLATQVAGFIAEIEHPVGYEKDICPCVRGFQPNPSFATWPARYLSH